MNITEYFTLFVVENPGACGAFYVEHFGFTQTVDMGWYVQVEAEGDAPCSLAFIQPGHESQSRSHDAVVAGNLFLTFGVTDATAECSRLIADGVPMSQGLRDEPWGKRHFIVKDPAGINIDVVEPIEPDAAFMAAGS